MALYAATGTFEPFLLLMIPALMLGSSNGYGGDTVLKKVARRVVFSLGMLLSGVVVCLTLDSGNAWALFVVQASVAFASVYVGVKNPISAPAEEVFVCALHCLVLSAYPFVKQ